MIIVNFILILAYALLYSIKNYTNISAIIISFIFIIYFLNSILYKKKLVYTKRNIIFACIFSIFVTIFTLNLFNTKIKTEKLEIKNIGNVPITVEAIYLDESIVKTNAKYDKQYDCINDASLKTEYQLYNKMDESYKMTLYPNKKYYLNISTTKDIEIKFQKNKKEGKIMINNKSYKIPSYKYENFKADMLYDSSYNYHYNNIKSNYSFYTIYMIILSLFIYFNIGLSILGDTNNKIKILALLILELNPIIKITNLTKSILCLLILFILHNHPKKINNKTKIIKCLVSLLISFTFVGDRLINDKVSLQLVCIYFMTFLLIYYLLDYIIKILEKIRCKKNIQNENKKILVHRIIIFILILGICALYAYIFYPYISHVDGSMEIHGVFTHKYANWHPYFHTLIIALFYKIFGKVQYFIYFRLIIYSLLVNVILFYFYKKGLSLKKIYIGSILFTIFPVTGVMLVTLVKDTDFTLALVALSFYLYLLIKDKKYFCEHKINYLFLTISLLATGIFRHNGLYILIVICFILIYISYKYKKIGIFIIVLITGVSVYIIEKPLYKYLNVEAGPRNVEISPLMHGFTYLIYENKNIDLDMYAYLTTKVFPKEAFMLGYDKYNIDLELHYTYGGFKNLKIDKRKVIFGYIKQFFYTPISLIKDRLYGFDMIWNVSEKDRVKNYKYQILYDEFETKYDVDEKYKAKYNKTLSDAINKFLIYIANDEFFNALFFRGGIYVSILLIFLYYFILKKKKEIIVFLPIILNALTLMIAMAHQEYRYVWVFELCTILIYLTVKYDSCLINKK